MTKVVWGEVGNRFFETGIDRGVLYVPGQPGAAWNGITAIRESVSGGDPAPYYLDGIKYLQIASTEDFVATLEALSAPSEFDVCDGTASIANGLFATQQPRKQFGLSYRTRIGNDIDGSDHAYKLHIVYNCLAAPSERNNASISDQSSPVTLSWSLSTVPMAVPLKKPSAHLIIDSRLMDIFVLGDIEDYLYGSEVTDPALPTPQQLISIVTGGG